jgi:transcriptional regulator GlxA family with amidase domain
VTTTSGFAVHVEHGLERMATADLITVPAWPVPGGYVPPPVVDALRAAVARGAQVLAVCTGAFPVAAAGLLDGRRAATHWQFADLLAERHPHVRVDREVLYVADGPIITSAGAAAGIDACLHLVRREHGTAIANAVARRMVVPAHRSGGQAQYVEMPVPPARTGHVPAGLLDWARAHLDLPLTVEELAERALMSPRTFARRFREVTGTTPHRWLLDRRLERAEELLERTDLPVDAVAARSGFGSADTLRHHFTARRGVSPSDHRRAFRPPAGAP